MRNIPKLGKKIRPDKHEKGLNKTTNEEKLKQQKKNKKNKGTK